MAGNIVYIQANDKIAESFKDTFAERNIELMVAKDAATAIDIMRTNEIDVLLVDINIPDMRLSRLVEICTREFPGVVLNVCIDVMNSLLVTKLVNRHAIRKIFVAPWSVSEMVEEIEESLDAAQIAREQKIYENNIRLESEHFEETLTSLTESLKRQQYSFNKIKAVTDVILSDLQNFNEEVDESQLKKIKAVFDRLLRMQTTESIDVDKFEDIIRRDMNEVSASFPGFVCLDIDSCLKKGIAKAKVAGIRFFIWLIALYSAMTREKCEMNVSSEFTDGSRFTFTINVSGTITRQEELLQKYVYSLLHNLCDHSDINETTAGECMTYTIEFSAADDIYCGAPSAF